MGGIGGAKRDMGWRHPDISLDDLVLLFNGFVDILILACGYQSSGLPAHWDASSIKNAVRWGLFFQDVFKRINGSAHYEDSIKELDAALKDVVSDPSFPQGLVYLSSSYLCKARNLVIEYLTQAQHLGAKHLTALITASIQLDSNELVGIYNANPAVYLDRLLLQMESLNLVPTENGNFVKSLAASGASGSNISGASWARNGNHSTSELNECNFADHSCFLIHEIFKRQASVSCISLAETGVDSILKLITNDYLAVPEKSSLEENTSTSNFPENMLAELFLWCQWRSRCLSYLGDKRTIKMLSGAKLIFSAPKVQWLQVFEPLKVTLDANSDNLLEILEILLLGFISGRWTNVIEQFMSHSCDYLPISEQCSLLYRSLQDSSQCAQPHMEDLSSMEKDIIGYVTALLDSQYHKLWLLPPVLVAAAIPSWSILFRGFWNEIEKRFVGAPLASSFNDCGQEEKEQIDCEVAERIRCLYAFHITRPQLKFDDS